MHICDRKATDQFVQNIKLSLTPNPIEIEPGKKITLDFRVDLLKEIPKGSTIALKLKKHEFIDFTIPCLHVIIISLINDGYCLVKSRLLKLQYQLVLFILHRWEDLYQ